MAVQQIQLRRDSAANWAASNPILALGEFAYVTDTGQVKVGDGITHYSSLGFGPTTATEGFFSITEYGAVAGGDAAAATQLAITAAAAAGGGTVYIPAGNWLWNSVPKLPNGITKQLHIRGEAGTKVTLTSGGPRFLDFNRTADFQVFKNIKVSNLLIDCDSIDGTTNNHVVIGTMEAGTETSQRSNFENIVVEYVNTINVPTSTTNVRRNVWITSHHLAAGEGTQTHITDFCCRHCNFQGGIYGVTIAGTGGSTSVNVYLDRWVIDDIVHDVGSDPSGTAGSAHVHVGSRATGGAGIIRNVRGRGSRDVGIEVNAMEFCHIDSCTMENSNGYYFLHANYAPGPQGQTIVYTNCHGRWTAGTHTADASGMFGFISVLSNKLGQVYVKNCSMLKNTADWTSDGTAMKIGTTSGSSQMVGLDVDGFYYHQPSVDVSTASVNPTTFWLKPTVATPVRMRNVRVTIAGTISTGTISVANVFGVYGPQTLDVDDVEFNISGMAAGSGQIRCFNIGQTTSSVLEDSVIRRAKFNLSDATTPDAFHVYGTTPLTINGTLRIIDPDFTGMSSRGHEIVFETGVENANQVSLITNDASDAAPSTGTHIQGERYWNTDPDATDWIGWVCTAGGSPGTWKGFGVIEA